MSHSKLFFGFIFTLFALFIVGCKNEKTYNITGSTFGTYYSVTYIGLENPSLKEEIDSVLRTIDMQFSVFNDQSLISKINRNETDSLSPDLEYLFFLSQKISHITLGAFDITLAPLIELWGFGNDTLRKLTPDLLDSVRQFVGFQMLQCVDGKLIKNDARVNLNFNAVAKGFAVDKVMALMRQKGFSNCVVDIGGEIVTSGSNHNRPWKIGIQVPTESADGPIEAQTVLECHNQAMATSGNYRSYIEIDGMRFSHILNPHTGKPEKSNLLSVTVLAQDCATADAFATAFMVMGVDSAKQILTLNAKDSLSAFFIYDKRGTLITERFPK